MFGYTTIFVTACLITVGSARGTRCRTCFDYGGRFVFWGYYRTKNCEKPSTSECATSKYTCMEFVGTIDIEKNGWRHSSSYNFNITTSYCEVTNQKGCQETDLADPNHDLTKLKSEIKTGLKKINQFIHGFSFKKISGSICESKITTTTTTTTAVNKNSGSAAIIGNEWQAEVFILLINILLMY